MKYSTNNKMLIFDIYGVLYLNEKFNDIKEGDILEITFGGRIMKVEIVSISEHVLKDDARSMYNVITNG